MNTEYEHLDDSDTDEEENYFVVYNETTKYKSYQYTNLNYNTLDHMSRNNVVQFVLFRDDTQYGKLTLNDVLRLFCC